MAMRRVNGLMKWNRWAIAMLAILLPLSAVEEDEGSEVDVDVDDKR